MDVEFFLHGIGFVANKAKMAANADKHKEARDAVIGMDTDSRLLFVVHIVQENDRIRLISARKATNAERSFYEND
jgi:uncharacterized DUF497 family protein